jgi:cyclopropane-fatty-acyl-phospholipid synthase
MDVDLNHSSAYFDSAEMSLDLAQQAKIRAVLDRCRIGPATKLLDIGCGWGAAALVASVEYQADVVGITLDSEQAEYARRRIESEPAAPRLEFRVQQWEEFDDPVDRIICINAFENFGNKSAFLPHCRSILERDGVMVMLTVTADRPMFRVLSKREVVASAEAAGFEVSVSDSLAGHYARTLDCFVQNLTKNRERAVSLVGEERVDGDVMFYSRCAGFLRSGLNDMFEFTFVAR